MKALLLLSGLVIFAVLLSVLAWRADDPEAKKSSSWGLMGLALVIPVTIAIVLYGVLGLWWGWRWG